MNCRHCKSKMNDGANICHVCGKNQNRLLNWLNHTAVIISIVAALTTMFYSYKEVKKATEAISKADKATTEATQAANNADEARKNAAKSLDNLKAVVADMQTQRFAMCLNMKNIVESSKKSYNYHILFNSLVNELLQSKYTKSSIIKMHESNKKLFEYKSNHEQYRDDINEIIDSFNKLECANTKIEKATH